MSRPSSTRIEMPWELDGRAVALAGDVVLDARWPRVEHLRARDALTDEDLELADADQDVAEEVLVEEAQRIWRAS